MGVLEEINSHFSSFFIDNEDIINDGIGSSLNKDRKSAFNVFKRVGVPYRTENYIYTDIISSLDGKKNILLDDSFRNIDIESIFRCNISSLETYVVFTLNGDYYSNNEKLLVDKGVIICSLKEASHKYKDIVSEYYNKHSSVADKDGMIALNTMFARDGVFLYIPENTVIDKPIQIINIINSENEIVEFQRNLVVMGKSSSASVLVCDHVIQNLEHFICNTTEISLAENSNLDYYQIQNQDINTSQVNTIFVDQRRYSNFESNMITLHGKLIRNNIYSSLKEEGANTNLYGAYLLDANQKVDNFTVIEHISPNCTSDEHYKGILDESALANFSGRIIVHKDAQKTEAYQANDNLLLSDTARVNTKPQLIIDADDVKCSHGSTVGQIDDEAIFYLQSRGIGKIEARTMMMFGFVNDIVRKIKIDDLGREINDLVNRRLRGSKTECDRCCVPGCEKI